MDTYTLHYEVPAIDRLRALIHAGSMLREGVVVDKVVTVRETSYGWWEVVLDVHDQEPVWLPETADPITAAKAEADR